MLEGGRKWNSHQPNKHKERTRTHTMEAAASNTTHTLENNQQDSYRIPMESYKNPAGILQTPIGILQESTGVH